MVVAQGLQRNKSQESDDRRLIRHNSMTNSQAAVGASQKEMDNRWEAFKQKQESHFQEGVGVLSITQLTREE